NGFVGEFTILLGAFGSEYLGSLWFAGLAALGVWIAVTLASRYVSLGSIVAAGAFLAFFIAFNWAFWGLSPARLWPLVVFCAVIVALILFRHRANISRLLAGTENKIGARCDAEGVGKQETQQG
ncbi:MAG TPA: hypothetical protein DCX07_01925, partial [Phycisphaerales bacterium]|nr:hypothetical protein [Phycisphaerales bacterium]